MLPASECKGSRYHDYQPRLYEQLPAADDKQKQGKGQQTTSRSRGRAAPRACSSRTSVIFANTSSHMISLSSFSSASVACAGVLC